MRRKNQPQLSFADAEMMAQGIELDERLQVISNFLDSHPELVDLVHQDLVRGQKDRSRGREGLNAERVLRSLILQRIKNWTLRALAERIADGFTLRMFTRFRTEKVPKHTAFNRAFNRIEPETLAKINDAVVRSAIRLGIDTGKKQRVDSTVVESNIHYPTDATLLWDTVRTINRLVKSVKKLNPDATVGFRRRTKAAKRCVARFGRRGATEEASGGIKGKYKKLIRIAEETLRSAAIVVEKGRMGAPAGLSYFDLVTLDACYREIEHYIGLGGRVVAQTRRRVLDGEQVPAHEKILSIFEPHTDLIKRGKANKPVEFGHKVFISEVASGLITQYAVLSGNPNDESHVPGSLERHRDLFGRAPEVYSADRGFYSKANIDLLRRRRVKVRSIPRRGRDLVSEQQQAHERSNEFRSAQRFRAGIEGRISVLLRGRGLRRCLRKGFRGFQCFVAAGVLANNLLVLASAMLGRKAVKRRKAA